MPEPVLDEHGEIDVEKDNALIESWSQTSGEYIEYDLSRIERFISRTETLLKELEELELVPDEPATAQYMTVFYDAAKDVFDHDKKMIRTYFLWLYLVLFHRPDGPRWGEFVLIYGVENFVDLVRTRFGEIQ